MKIQLLSDLHNEFLRNGKRREGHHWSGSIPDTDADVIVLAGDIDVGVLGAEWAVSESERLGKSILYLLGNHEFYRYEYYSVKEDIARICKDTLVQYLGPGVFVQDDVRILGTTLWTDYDAYDVVPREQSMRYIDNCLTDHRLVEIAGGSQVERFTPQHALDIHKRELGWLNDQLSQGFDGKTVVVTHHGPHHVCQHPAFPMSEMSGAFHSDLSGLIEGNDIAVWAFGHTHANVDEVVANTRIVSNQAGYPGEDVEGFDSSFVIEL